MEKRHECRDAWHELLRSFNQTELKSEPTCAAAARRSWSRWRMMLLPTRRSNSPLLMKNAFTLQLLTGCRNVVAFIRIWIHISNPLRMQQQFRTFNWGTTTGVVPLYQVQKVQNNPHLSEVQGRGVAPEIIQGQAWQALTILQSWSQLPGRNGGTREVKPHVVVQASMRGSCAPLRDKARKGRHFQEHLPTWMEPTASFFNKLMVDRIVCWKYYLDYI